MAKIPSRKQLKDTLYYRFTFFAGLGTYRTAEYYSQELVDMLDSGKTTIPDEELLKKYIKNEEAVIKEVKEQLKKIGE